MNKQKIFRTFLLALPAFVSLTLAEATPDEAPCGLVEKIGKGAQVIPKQGKVQIRFDEHAPVSCGSMLISHEEAFWVKTKAGVTLKLAPHSFVEIPSSKMENYRLYRGSVLMSAAPGVPDQTWSTPNSEAVFKGGVIWLQYESEARKTTVASFNRQIQFSNKFNSEARQTVSVGEMSSLVIQDAQVVPSQPVVMNPPSVAAALDKLALVEADKKEMMEIVKRVYEDRSRSLASEIEEWDDEVQPTEEAGRSIASLEDGKSKKHAIDPKEANFVMKMMKAKLYGSDEELENTMSGERKPASVSLGNSKLVDSEQSKQKKNFKMETKRIEKEIDRLSPDAE